jgi:hypothetical protein
MTEEVAYFRYVREYQKRFNYEEDTTQYKYGQVLRPDTYTPNYEFYVPDLVCWKHERPRVKWADTYNKWSAEVPEDLQGFTCIDCELLDPVSFKKCPSCQGAFYDLFRHPYQTRSYHHCWNCLEAGSNDVIHTVFNRYGKLAPPYRLIPPVVTMADVAKGEESFWDNVQRLLNE